jgi:hypothetical protein
MRTGTFGIIFTCAGISFMAAGIYLWQLLIPTWMAMLEMAVLFCSASVVMGGGMVLVKREWKRKQCAQ